MKFLIINGKLQRDETGKLITVPDNYNNEPITLGGKLLKTGGSIAGSKFSLPQLSTPQNVTIDGTTLSFDEVENASYYEIFADGTSIGEVNN